MWTKFGLKLRKILRCGRPGGGGGLSVISDTPGRGGEGGSKKGKFLRTSFMDGPLFSVLCAKIQHSTQKLIINSITEVSESFLLDITVIDLMSIVHVDKIWVRIARKF